MKLWYHSFIFLTLGEKTMDPKQEVSIEKLGKLDGKFYALGHRVAVKEYEDSFAIKVSKDLDIVVELSEVVGISLNIMGGTHPYVANQNMLFKTIQKPEMVDAIINDVYLRGYCDRIKKHIVVKHCLRNAHGNAVWHQNWEGVLTRNHISIISKESPYAISNTKESRANTKEILYKMAFEAISDNNIYGLLIDYKMTSLKNKIVLPVDKATQLKYGGLTSNDIKTEVVKMITKEGNHYSLTS